MFFVAGHWKKIPFYLTVCAPTGLPSKKSMSRKAFVYAVFIRRKGFIPNFPNINIIKMLKIKNGLSFDRAMWYNMLIRRQTAVAGNGCGRELTEVKKLKSQKLTYDLQLKLLQKIINF